MTLALAYMLRHLSAAWVATSDKGGKVQVEVSTDWYVAVEHWRSSSMRVYLCRLSD